MLAKLSMIHLKDCFTQRTNALPDSLKSDHHRVCIFQMIPISYLIQSISILGIKDDYT